MKPGESPEEIARKLTDLYLSYNGYPSTDEIASALKAYGDRRGEEERAKALVDAAALVESDASYQEHGDPRERALRTAAARIRSLAAAPSGDAKGTK